MSIFPSLLALSLHSSPSGMSKAAELTCTSRPAMLLGLQGGDDSALLAAAMDPDDLRSFWYCSLWGGGRGNTQSDLARK